MGNDTGAKALYKVFETFLSAGVLSSLERQSKQSNLRRMYSTLMRWNMNRACLLNILLASFFAAGPAYTDFASVHCSPFNRVCLLAAAQKEADQLGRTSHRDEAHFAITVAFARLGQVARARQQALLIENLATRAEAEAEIVKAAALAGDFDLAFMLAINIEDARNTSARVAALETLAIEQAAKGYIDAAFDTVAAITNPFRQSQAQAAIALSVARSLDFTTAIHAATRIGIGYWFTNSEQRYKVASGLVARSGEFDQYWFFEALAEIAAMQARSSDTAAAVQTALAIPDQGGRTRAMARIAATLASDGKPTEALKIARLIDSAYGDREALVALSDAYAAAGDMASAQDLARQLQDAYGDGVALANFAIRQAQNGEHEQALATATEIHMVPEQERAYARLAMELARRDAFDRAFSVLARITGDHKRFEAVLDITADLATLDAGSRATAFATSFATGDDLDELVSSISIALASSGDPTAALWLLADINDPMFRAITLAAVASGGAN